MTRHFSGSRRGLLTLLLLGASSAHADCVDTVGLSAAEKDFQARAQAVLMTFLRPAPQGQNIRWQDSGGAQGTVVTCKGEPRKSGDFSVVVGRKFIWPDPRQMRGDATVQLSLTLNAQSLPPAHEGGAFGPASPQRSAGLVVHNVTWVAKSGGWGDPAQEAQLRNAVLAALDTAGLQALLAKPLPPVAASNAAAKAAQPFALDAAAPTAAHEAVASPAPQAAPTNAATPAAPVQTAASAARVTASEVKDQANAAVQKLRGLFGR